MVDLLGPADAGASPTLTTTTDVTSPVSGDSWFEDCISGVGGTPIDSKWLNRLMQQARAAIRSSNVPVSNAYDEMLSWAIQSGYANWVGNFGGTVNALTGPAPNSPQAIEGGTVVCGIITAPTNTGAVTFNWAGLGAQNVNLIDGSACVGGELPTGNFLVLRWDGGNWRVVSPVPIMQAIVLQNPFTKTSIGAVIVTTGVLTTFSGPLTGSLGQVSTWSTGSGVYRIGANPQCYALDARWPSSPPPGSWEMVSISAQPTDFSSLTPASTIIVAWERIA